VFDYVVLCLDVPSSSFGTLFSRGNSPLTPHSPFHKSIPDPDSVLGDALAVIREASARWPKSKKLDPADVDTFPRMAACGGIF
jgi:hypothetical protein